MSEPRPTKFRDLLALVPREPLLVAPGVVRFRLLPKPVLPPTSLASDGEKKPLVFDYLRESLPPASEPHKRGPRDSLRLPPPITGRLDETYVRVMRNLRQRVMAGAAYLTVCPIYSNPIALLSMLDVSAAARAMSRSEVLISLGLDKLIDWNHDRFVEMMSAQGKSPSFDGLLQVDRDKLMAAVMAGLTLPKEYETLLRYQPDPHSSYLVAHGADIGDFDIDYLPAAEEASPQSTE